MALNLHQLNHKQEEEEEDYIDMEVSSTSNLFFSNKNPSPQHQNEFEFQMFSSSSERETTSPADELFYKGKLLPLHLPPRLQMFEKLLQNSSPFTQSTQNFEDEHFITPLTTTPGENTPFESCNISPFESTHVSKELNPDEYFSEYSKGVVSFDLNQKKSWAKKLKLGSKLKASHAYLKSFFNKPSSSDQSAPNTEKTMKKGPFGQIHGVKYQVSKSFKNEKKFADGMSRHRRSFSGAIKRLSMNKSLKLSHSSSNFGNSNSSSDVESSIEGAIAHCKRSQHEFPTRKTVSEIGFYSLSTSSLMGCEVQDRLVLCRG